VLLLLICWAWPDSAALGPGAGAALGMGRPCCSRCWNGQLRDPRKFSAWCLDALGRNAARACPSCAGAIGGLQSQNRRRGAPSEFNPLRFLCPGQIILGSNAPPRLAPDRVGGAWIAHASSCGALLLAESHEVSGLAGPPYAPPEAAAGGRHRLPLGLNSARPRPYSRCVLPQALRYAPCPAHGGRQVHLACCRTPR